MTAPADIAALLAAAVAHVNAGNLAAAADALRRVLEADPENGEALNGLGVLTFERGDKAAALDLLTRAVDRLPNDPATFFNLSWVLISVGRNLDAIARCDAGLARHPDYPGLHTNRAWALLNLGRAAEALESSDAAIRLAPTLANAYVNRGWALLQLGRDAEGLAACDAAIAINPGAAPAHSNRAWALVRLGRYLEAIEASDRALAIEPNLEATHTNRGVALTEMRRFAEALESFTRALEIGPETANAHFNRSLALNGLKRSEEALVESARALELQPDLAEAYSSRGRSFHDLGRYEEALACYARTLELDPSLAVAHYNRATTLVAQLRLEEAWESYRLTLAATPDDPDPHTDLAMARLLTGDFARGLPEYEWRWQTVGAKAQLRDFGRPAWRGKEDISGRRILLFAEQGYGDMIQFARYITLVARRGAHVVLEAPASLASLLRGVEGVAEFVERGAPPPDFDFHCPLMSLPLAFGTDLGSIPASPRYLAADPAKVAAWRARIGPAGGARVGLVWSGSTTHLNDLNRSLAFAAFAGALPAGPAYVCLQKDLRDSDRDPLAARPDVAFYGDILADFGDTAALCELMDVVVTVDTSVAHLAGALGRPVLLLLPFSPDWRWLLGREDSPWYPTMRLLRQAAPRDWSVQLAAVRAALEARASIR